MRRRRGHDGISNGTAQVRNGAVDGTRTRDHSDHNRGLYQLSYNRHNNKNKAAKHGAVCALSLSLFAKDMNREQR